MMNYIAYRFRLYPNKQQRVFFTKSFGCMRKIWNLLLQQFMETRILVTPKFFKAMFPYLKEVDSLGLTNVRMQLKQALKNHAVNPKHFGEPRFKKKHACRDSYTTNNQHASDGHPTIYLSERYLKLPKIGLVRCKRHRSIPDTYVLKSVTVSCNAAGHYYASVLFAYEEEQSNKIIDVTKAVGFDYKSDGLIVSSEGQTKGSPKYYRKSEKRLVKQQQKLSRKHKDSQNWEKQRIRLAKLHEHVTNQRKNFLHQLSAEITNQYDVICIESLNMQTLANNGFGNGKATLDNGFGMFVDMLRYKCERKGKVFIQVDKWFPSSQLCNICGSKHSFVKDLRIRRWTCPDCGMVHDRDLNAARNIKQEGLRLYALSCV